MWHSNPILAFGSIAISIGILIVLHFFSSKHQVAKYFFGVFVFIIAFEIGFTTATIHKENLNPNHYVNLFVTDETNHAFELIVHEKLKSSTKNNRYVAKIITVDGHNCRGKILLNLSKDSLHPDLNIGNQVLVTGVIYKNKEPLNPNQFDYSRYLENQEIYAQIFTKANQVTFQKNQTTVWSSFANLREKISRNLNHSAISKDELNVVNALVLGQRQDISPDILRDYQYAGAVHVLSVSGLHVGFLLLFITFLLKPIGNSKKGLLLKLLITILTLWCFAILAGLSSSIVRSAAMFSFVAIGMYVKRTVNIYHTLLVSMLLILLFKPSFLFDVGFQLSYLALFFILWLQPVLAKIWTPKFKIVSYFWNIITVSFAAQIGTMPLSIYYFHQFPSLFFVTNLLILPLLGIIMALGILAVGIASFQTVPYLVSKPLELLIKLLNGCIHWVASMEHFVVKNISFSTDMLWGSYLVIIALILWLKKPEFKRMSLAFISIVLFQVIILFQKIDLMNKEELIVFQDKKTTLIASQKGDDVVLYSTNDSLLKNFKKNQFIQSYLTGNFCHVKALKKMPNMLFYKNKKILIIDSSCIYSKEIIPDIVIITQSPKLNLERLLATIQPKQIVADGSNFRSYISIWEATCDKQKIPFHNTNEKGFYKF
jgi:competence protein ComEC